MKYLVVILALSLVLVGCAEINEFFGLDDEDDTLIIAVIPPEVTWAPDKSIPFEVNGRIEDSDTGSGLQGVKIIAKYTIDCPTIACEPFTEKIEATTDENGLYVLELYSQFWDITYEKTSYNFEKIHISKEETLENNVSIVDLSFKIGIMKEWVGFVRDQGKRLIIDRGGTGGYSINFDSIGHYYEYVVVQNNPESDLYSDLLDLNNNELWIKGYVSPLDNNQAGIEIISYREI